MNKRRIIGFVLILLAISIVVFSLVVKKQVDDAFQNAQNEILVIANGEKVGKVGEFHISYIYSHGTQIVNAEPLFDEDIKNANVELIRGEEVVYLRFKDGATTRGGGPVGSDNIVVVKSPFDGKMLFKYGVCGCENIGSQMLIFIATVLGFIITIIALFLIIKKKSSNNTDAPKSVTASPEI
ncbi:MAG TPA: hypothetical protein DET40_09085 [Lentisphaeria bacterium]|nr:MAG: hypothetical protein A2X45_07880 [Lentisphaerae bacterium GWF2_50_93]HCE43690.1 hypothetical protein [Lentisphaeria bacterium]